jgi:ABC-type multidrug transport system, permease component
MKTIYIINRIIKQMINDKRSLALVLVVPIFLFTLLYFLLGDSDYKASITTNGIPTQLIEQLEAEDVTVKSAELAEGKKEVKEKETDALLYMDGKDMVLLFESGDTVKTGIISKALQKALKNISQKGELRMEYLYGENGGNLFNSLGYVLLGVISFFLIFILAGISFVRERTVQTMERLMTTPVKRWQVVLGYTIGFGIFAMLQSVILLCYSKWVLQMTIKGSLVEAGLLMILLSMSAVCIGAFCSIYANNEFQMMQFLPVIVIPQIFFSGLISLDTLPYHLGYLSKIMPVYYACDALSQIIIKGFGLEEVVWDIIALLTFIVIFFILNIIALKKYRRL